MKTDGIKTTLTNVETKALTIELVQCFYDGYQNTLAWKTREQFKNIVTDYIAFGVKPDLAVITKEGLLFILNIIPSENGKYFDTEMVFKRIRKRCYKVIENRTKRYYN